MKSAPLLFNGLALSIVLGLFALLGPEPAAAQVKTPVLLLVNHPESNKSFIPTQMSSGWPITITLRVREDAPLAAYSGVPSFPGQGQTGYVVLDDPDGCLRVFPSFILPVGCDPTQPLPPPDETYIEFTPDTDMPNVVDFSGNDALRPALTNANGGGPLLFRSLNQTGVVEDRPLGPFSGGGVDVNGAEIEDGYGIGAPDDDLPGLVVVTETGAGLVLDENFNPPPVMAARNLAGLLSNVTYQLNGVFNRTSITASMVVPRSVFAPFIKVDNCVGNSSTCDQPSLWRINGGPLQTAPNNDEIVKAGYPALFEEQTTLIRIFLVSGTAPAELADENGDGRIDRRDATAAGYTVLSNQAQIRVRQIHGDACFNGMRTIIYEDFDGNGLAQLGIVCPAGAGGVSRVPR